MSPLVLRRFRLKLLLGTYPAVAPLAALYRRTVLRRLRVVAVVGSFGKTTTTEAIRATLGARCTGRAAGNRGFYIARALFSSRPAGKYAVIEAGIEKPGEMRRHASMLRPDMTVVTSVGSAHNRFLTDLTVTRWEKSRMVAATRTDGMVLLNGDDHNARWMRSETRSPVLTYGFDAHNQVRAVNYRLRWPEGSSFCLEGEGLEPVEIHSRLVGRMTVYPLLAAIAVARRAGVPMAEIVRNLTDFSAREMRLQPVRLESGAFLLRDEFKYAWETVETALDLLREAPARRRIVVMGDVTDPPGTRDEVMRRLGRSIAEVAHRAIFLTPHFEHFRAGAAEAGLRAEHWVDAGNDVFRVVGMLRETLGRGDVLLVKGRSNQRLERVSLALMGYEVRCRVPSCRAVARCRHCPRLELESPRASKAMKRSGNG